MLVLRVREGDAGYLDPAGNHVPKTLLTGKGNALLFHNGRMVAANWQKGKADSPITLTTKKGAPLKVPAGHTWIELVPVDGGTRHLQEVRPGRRRRPASARPRRRACGAPTG